MSTLSFNCPAQFSSSAHSFVKTKFQSQQKWTNSPWKMLCHKLIIYHKLWMEKNIYRVNDIIHVSCIFSIPHFSDKEKAKKYLSYMLDLILLCSFPIFLSRCKLSRKKREKSWRILFLINLWLQIKVDIQIFFCRIR